MAKNPYRQQHADFCAWIERHRSTMSSELLDAAETFRCKLWETSRRPDLPSDFVANTEQWARVFQAHRDAVNRASSTSAHQS